MGDLRAAAETRFNRRVVIKVLSPELAAGVNAERHSVDFALVLAGLKAWLEHGVQLNLADRRRTESERTNCRRIWRGSRSRARIVSQDHRRPAHPHRERCPCHAD